MSLKVTVVDEQTGDTETAHVRDGNYILICSQPCDLHHTQISPITGTVQLTIKGWKPS